MTYSASQLIAVSGFSQNLGLQVSSAMLNRIADCQDITVLSGKLRQMLTHPNSTNNVVTICRTKIPGISMTVPASFSTVPEGFVFSNLSDSVKELAEIYFNNGVAGYLNRLGQAANACRAARDILGSVYFLETEGFSGVAPDVSNHNDLVTGGITSKFGPLAVGSQDYLRASGLYTGGSAISATSADIKRSIESVADAIDNLGTLYDFTRLESLGTAYGLINNLLLQGLIKTEFIQTFENQNVDVNALQQASESVLISILEQIQGKDVQRIITGTGLKQPTNSIIQNAADLLKTDKVITIAAINAIPGGKLTDLAAALISLNVNYETKEDLVTTLRNIELLDTPTLSSLSKPVPTVDTQSIRSSFPSGSGDFGSPFIQEIIGTPSGYIHTDTFSTVFRVCSSIASTAESIALIAACNTVLAAYDADADPTAAENAFETAVDNLIALSSISSLLDEADTAIGLSTAQVILEENNQLKGGIDIQSYIPGSATLSQLTSLLTTLGTDSFNSGATSMLLDMLTDDIYGEATRAVLLQGKNEQTLKLIGKETIGISDIERLALGVRAAEGEGLTAQQRENVIDDARSRNLDINTALANAAFYGYNNQYYTSRGYPKA